MVALPIHYVLFKCDVTELHVYCSEYNVFRSLTAVSKTQLSFYHTGV